MVPLDENTAATTPYIADPPRVVSDELFDSSQVPEGYGLIVTVRNQQELDALDLEALPAGSVINLASHETYDFKHRDTTGLQVLMSDISVPEPPAPSPWSSAVRPPKKQWQSATKLPPLQAEARQSPNAPCRCGSGKKFKKCCR